MRKYTVRRVNDQDSARMKRWRKVGMPWVVFRDYEEFSERMFSNFSHAMKWAAQDISARRRRNNASS
jgi:hypothetical protein